MASLFGALPAPKNNPDSLNGTTDTKLRDVAEERAASTVSIPAYGARDGWLPRSQEAFGGGGAYPEIPVAQYPLNMGREKEGRKALAKTVDGKGKVQWNKLADKKGSGKVASHHRDLVVHHPPAAELERPSEEDAEALAERTRAALADAVAGRATKSSTGSAVSRTKREEATYYKYTPGGGAAGNMERTIRMVELPQDPLDPPKFQAKRTPKGPGSPPVPVMHSPPRKITVKEQQEWKIPPCISNWKNAKGYVIPLDKRLAADGRRHSQTGVQINDNFAKLSEALYIAERNAREEVEKRALIQKKLKQREREAKEEELRELAANAWKEKQALSSGGRGSGEARRRADSDSDSDSGGDGVDGGDEARRRRDQIRAERRREREREHRYERAGSGVKRGRLAREGERDISEKIALGMATGGGAKGNEALFDQRLFNQTGGMDSGFGADDAYNVYDKPLFGAATSKSLYRPKRSGDADAYGSVDDLMKTARFKPDKGFKGAEEGQDSGDGERRAARDGPVQFERKAPERDAEEADPFGLDDFVARKKARK